MECGVLLHKKGPSSSKKERYAIWNFTAEGEMSERFDKRAMNFPPLSPKPPLSGLREANASFISHSLAIISCSDTCVKTQEDLFTPLSLSFSLTPALFLFMLTISSKILLLDSNFILRRGSFDHRIHLQTVARLPLDGLAISGKDLTHLFCVVNTSISWLNKTFFWMKKDNNNKKKSATMYSLAKAVCVAAWRV